MAITEEFDYLVLGDEPAGLWLLSELDRLYESHGSVCRGGWITKDPKPAPRMVSVSHAKDYGIKCDAPFHLDLVTGEESFPLKADALISRYPRLAPQLFEKPSGHTNSLAAESLKHHPQLLNFAKGYWKFFGRAPSLAPERLLQTACEGSELGWWNPPAEFSENTVPIDVSQPEKHITHLFFSKRGMVSLQLADETTLLTRCLIINTSLHDLEALAKPIAHLHTNLDLEPASLFETALYPFQIDAKPLSVSQGTPPLFVFFEQSQAVDTHAHIWPVECQRLPDRAQLRLWASWSRALCLDTVLGRFRDGLRHLSQLFPFLDEQTLRYSLPLDASSCALDEERAKWFETLSELAVEKYSLTRIHTHTRRPNLHYLAPSLHCELPYPFGPLSAARSLLSALASQKKWPKSRGGSTSDEVENPAHTGRDVPLAP